MDILAVLYSGVVRVRPREAEWPHRDRVILSKGHAAMALYAVLAECGFLDVAELDTYGKPGSRLCGHADWNVPGVDVSTGSLGHGLSIGCGIALAGKASDNPWRVFAVLSDGECQEGSVWEAAMFAAHHGLNNLTVVVDRNGLQACGSTEDVLCLEPFADKWKAFGWTVTTVDGHEPQALWLAMSQPLDAPHIIIARTVKGKGVSFMENRVEWHYRHPDRNELAVALSELEPPA